MTTTQKIDHEKEDEGPDKPPPIRKPNPATATPFSKETPELLRNLIEAKEYSVPTFSEALNYNLNGGLRRKMLIGIASPPGEGKTTFAWQLAQHIAEHGKMGVEHPVPVPCLYVSLEMAQATLYSKALSRICRIDGGVLSGRKWLTEENPDVKDQTLKDIVKANRRLTKFSRHLRVLDVTEARPGRMTIRELRNQANAFLESYQAHMELELMRGAPDPEEREELVFALERKPHLVIVVDHLQLLRNLHNTTTTGYLSHDPAVSYDLKHLAVSMDCTVVALSRMASPQEDPVVQGADMTAVLRTGYNVIEDKLRDLDQESREMKSESAATEDREELQRERTGHRRLRSQKPLQTEGSPIYASLDIEKNREGRTRHALFIWRRAFHEFEEVEVGDESRSFRRFLPWEG